MERAKRDGKARRATNQVRITLRKLCDRRKVHCLKTTTPLTKSKLSVLTYFVQNRELRRERGYGVCRLQE